MYNLTFKKFIGLFEHNPDSEYADECVDLLKNGDCIFESGIIESPLHLSGIYKTRFKTALEGGIHSKKYIDDFERCVQRLLDSNEPHLGISALRSDNHSFLCFYEPNTQVMLGILKAEASGNLKKCEDQNADIIRQGQTCNSEKYSKGVLVRHWK